MNTNLRRPLALAGLLLATPLLMAGEAGAPAPADGRTVVVGFDGADARTVERLMAEGRLPNLQALAEAGTFAQLRSTNPAESAAGWAALNTGTNPLKNNVPSFIKRQPSGSPLPDFGQQALGEAGDVTPRDFGGREGGGGRPQQPGTGSSS